MVKSATVSAVWRSTALLFSKVVPNKYIFSFMVYLFNYAVSSSSYIVLNDIMSNEQNWIDVKKVGMAKIKVSFWNFPGETEENHEIPVTCHIQSLCQDMNPEHPDYEAGPLSTQLWHSVPTNTRHIQQDLWIKLHHVFFTSHSENLSPVTVIIYKNCTRDHLLCHKEMHTECRQGNHL
jgi:hypothetical protein